MNEHPNNPVYSKQVIEMLTVANEYCLFMEKCDDYPIEDILSYCRHILPLIYLKGSLVKPLIPAEPDDAERFVTEESWESLFNTLRNKFYPDDHFWMCQDPRDENTEIEKNSLAEHLADIYQDMKDFVMLYQKNRHSARENAIAGIASYFMDHYGPAITKSLYALHLLETRA